MAFLTAIMVVVALYFGLRTRGNGNANDVFWLPDKMGLRFQGSGMAYVDDLSIDRSNRMVTSLTIELIVRPGRNQWQGFGPLVLLHDGNDQQQVVIWQYQDSLIVMNGNDYNNAQRWPRITGMHILEPDQIRYLTITANKEKGTRLFVDGELVATKQDWRLRIPHEGKPLRLVLSNSVYGNHGWTGDIYELGVAAKAISSEQVRERYTNRVESRTFPLLKTDLPEQIIKLDQQSWLQTSDPTLDSPLLIIPPEVIALEKAVLSTPQAYFKLNRVTIAEISLNIFGFVPLGAMLFASLGSYYGFDDRRKWIALLFCAALSLGIELAQVWIPTRFSTLLDLLLNTIGAWIGIELLYWFRKLKFRDSV